MIKFSLFLRVFLQVIFAQNILSSSSDILQLKYPDLQTLVTELTDESQTDHGSSLLQSVEQSLSTDGAFVSRDIDSAVFSIHLLEYEVHYFLWSHFIAFYCCPSQCLVPGI